MYVCMCVYVYVVHDKEEFVIEKLSTYINHRSVYVDPKIIYKTK